MRIRIEDLCPHLPKEILPLFDSIVIEEAPKEAFEILVNGRKMRIAMATLSWEGGYKIKISPDIMKELDEESKEDLMLHEILHVLQGHLSREGREKDPVLWGLAEDAWINERLMRSGRKSKLLTELGITAGKLAKMMGLPSLGYLSPEMYFSLMKRYLAEDKDDVYIMDYVSLTSGSEEGKSLSEEDKSLMEVVRGEILSKATSSPEAKELLSQFLQGGRGKGETPIQVPEYLVPEAPQWFKELIRLLQSDWRLGRARSWRRGERVENLPGWPQRYIHSPASVILAIDVSGSLTSNKKALHWFFRLSSLLYRNGVKGKVWYFDDGIRERAPLGRKIEQTFGGGGTSYNQLVEEVSKGDVLILATDAYPYKWPSPPEARVILVLSKRHGEVPDVWKKYPCFEIED